MLKRLALIGVAGALAACQSSPETKEQQIHAAGRAPAVPSSTGDRPAPGSPHDAAAPGSRNDAAPPPPPTVVSEESIDVLGTTRAFVLATPTTYSPNKTYPLVLVLHGDGGDGVSMRAAFPFDALSAQAAFVVYPSGTFGWNLYDPADTNPDLTYLATLVDSLGKRFTIDPARVFGIGFSSGAFMLNQVGCRRPSLFRAIVPHSGGAPTEPRDPTASHWDNNYTRCANQTMGSGPAVLAIHGTADTTVTFDSGDFTARYWAFINGCQSTRSKSTPQPCVLHDGCPAARPVGLCPIDNLGHTVWADAATAAWQFFSAF